MGAPTGRVKLSERKLNTPAVPGAAVAAYSVSHASSFSTRKYVSAQSPMTL